MFDLEAQIRTWKSHLYAAGSISHADIDELESHLRDSIDDLTAKGISTEETFLIAIRRLGDISIIHDEFAKISTEDIWKHLLVPSHNPVTARRERKELGLVVGLTLLAGLLSKIPALLGSGDAEQLPLILAKNAALFACFPVAIYFIWKRSLPLVRSISVLGLFVLSAAVVNLYPSYEPYHTTVLTIIHLPIALLFLLLYFYGGPSARHTGWQDTNTRLNFVRFMGEAFIYVILIGMGGLVLIFLIVGTFELVGIDASPFIISWVAPFGFFGLFPVAAYIVSKKKHLIESIAPILAKIFTPLFLIALMSLIVAFLMTPGKAIEDREMLIWFDLILAFVLALTLYTMSAKDLHDSPGHDRRLLTWDTLGDILTLALIVSALIIDGIALFGIIMRLTASGFTPNKSAALGENILLLVNLVLLAIGYTRYLFGRRSFQDIVNFQMRFLPLYAMWASFVVVVFPLMFRFR